MMGGAKPPISGQGVRGQDRRAEAKRPKWSIGGMGFLETGKLASSPLASALGVLNVYALYKSTHSLTHLLTKGLGER